MAQGSRLAMADVDVAGTAAKVETEQTERPGVEREAGGRIEDRPPTEENGPIAALGAVSWLEEDRVVADKGQAGVASGVVALYWEGGEEVNRPDWRPLTKYEEKAREAGRRVRDFSYRLGWV